MKENQKKRESVEELINSALKDEFYYRKKIFKEYDGEHEK